MARISCMVCWVPCTWCVWKCKCWMRDTQAKQANEIFLLYPNLLQDNLLANRVIDYVKKWIRKEDIIKSIETWEEPEVNESISITSQYCEYPVWSWWKWAWVECIKCWLPRFEWLWKLCKWIKE